MVNMHKDLLKPGESCRGGGFYEFDYAGSRIILSRRSYDFGRPRWYHFDELLVPKVYEGLRLIYRDDDGEETDLGSVFKISYVDD